MNTIWTQYMADRIKHVEKRVPWWVNNKSTLNQFCLDNEIPAPIVFKQWESPEKADFSGLPERFVLKPNLMSSSAGVMILHGVGNDQYYDSMSKSTMSKQEIIDKQTELYQKSKYKKSYRLMTEEIVMDARDPNRIPIDYKVYCFYDEPVLIQQIDRNIERTGTSFFDGQFQPFNLEGRIESDWKHYQLIEPIRPGIADEMLRISAKLTKAIKTPFMRVDLYNSTRGALVGELTPAPGGPYHGTLYKFTEQYDLELGKKWADALARIEKDS